MIKPHWIIVKAFKNFTCYYDPKDFSFWFWDGEKCVGRDIEDIYEELKEGRL